MGATVPLVASLASIDVGGDGRGRFAAQRAGNAAGDFDQSVAGGCACWAGRGQPPRHLLAQCADALGPGGRAVRPVVGEYRQGHAGVEAGFKKVGEFGRAAQGLVRDYAVVALGVHEYSLIRESDHRCVREGAVNGVDPSAGGQRGAAGGALNDLDPALIVEEEQHLARVDADEARLEAALRGEPAGQRSSAACSCG